MHLPSDIYRHTDSVKMLGLQKWYILLYEKHSVISLFRSFIFSLYHFIVTKIQLVRLFNEPHIFIPTCTYEQWLKVLDKVQSENFQFAT